MKRQKVREKGKQEKVRVEEKRGKWHVEGLDLIEMEMEKKHRWRQFQ